MVVLFWISCVEQSIALHKWNFRQILISYEVALQDLHVRVQQTSIFSLKKDGISISSSRREDVVEEEPVPCKR